MGNNRNIIIAIVAIIGVCACAACVSVGGFLYYSANIATSASATITAQLTLQPISTPFVVPTFNAPTLPPIPTFAGVPTVSFTPPVVIPRATPSTAATAPRVTPTTGGIISKVTPAAGTTKVVFTDNFDGTCNLKEGDSTDRTFKCENKSYSMLNKTKASRWVYYDTTYDDFVMEFDSHVVSGPSFIEYGGIFRVSDDGTDFYGFTLTRDGKYTLWRCESPCQDSNDFVDLISYTTSPSVKTGTGLNHVKIVAQGTQIAVYVNDQWLNTITDDTYSDGTVGFFLNNEDPNAKVAFEHLNISQISGTLNLPKGVPTPTKTPTK